MERPIDFSRPRHMLCGQCDHRWTVDLDWIDRSEQAQEECPGCGVNCEEETAPRVTVDPDDLALNDTLVAQLDWYHTSTQPDWPTSKFDPTAQLTDQTRRMMGGVAHVARWAESQCSKALHIGTYEAAVHNMLRRIDDQADHGRPFYLYRVHLKSTISVREGWLIDPSNFVGDVILDEVCPPGIDVVRYLNYHEDPGGLSVALGRTAIASLQRIAIPQASVENRGWIARTVAEVANAVETSPPRRGSHRLARFRLPSSPQIRKADEIAAQLAQRLPVNLRSQFQSAAALSDSMNHETWARHAIGLVDMIENPATVMTLLDTQGIRLL